MADNVIVLLSYLIVFGLGVHFGRRKLRPTEGHSLIKLAEGAIAGWFLGKSGR